MPIKRPGPDDKDDTGGTGGNGSGGSTGIPGVIITVPVKIITIPIIINNNGIPNTRPNGDGCQAYNGCERSPNSQVAVEILILMSLKAKRLTNG